MEHHYTVEPSQYNGVDFGFDGDVYDIVDETGVRIPAGSQELAQHHVDCLEDGTMDRATFEDLAFFAGLITAGVSVA